MKSPSLDKLYIKLDKHILLAQSYTEIAALAFILKTCRMKPYEFIFQHKSTKLILFRKWFDEFGNTLEITTNKRIKLIHNDLTLPRKQLVCTDLYYGLSMDKIAKISKLVYIFSGKDEDLYQDCVFISFLGIDECLRSYLYMYDEWQMIPTLMLGIKNLSFIYSNRDIKYFLEFSNKKIEPIPCISTRQWLSYLPASQDFKDLMGKQCSVVSPLFI